MNPDVGAGLTLDRSRIPQSLHDLIPLIERWGFESLTDQNRFVALMQAEHPSDMDEFNRRIDDARDAIVAWGESIPEIHRHKSEMDEDSWNHPYWSFLAALKVRELTGPDDSPAVAAGRARTAAEARAFHFSNAAGKASTAFRAGEYQRFVDLLEPFDDLLTALQRKKIEFAKRRLDGVQ